MFGTIFLAAILLPTSVISVRSCTGKDMTKCTSLIQTTPGRSFQCQSYGEFEKLCGEVDQFQQCIDEVLPYCDEQPKKLLEGLSDAYHFLCRDKKDGYLKHHSCFDAQALNTDGNLCVKAYNDQFNPAIQRHMLELVEDKDGTEKLCSIIDEYKECMHTAVANHCSKEAAKFEKEFRSKRFQPISAYYKCPSSGVPMSTYGYIAVTLLVVVVVIVSIVACKIKRGNCKKQPTGGDFNNPLESAYDNKV